MYAHQIHVSAQCESACTAQAACKSIWYACMYVQSIIMHIYTACCTYLHHTKVPLCIGDLCWHTIEAHVSCTSGVHVHWCIVTTTIMPWDCFLENTFATELPQCVQWVEKCVCSMLRLTMHIIDLTSAIFSWREAKLAFEKVHGWGGKVDTCLLAVTRGRGQDLIKTNAPLGLPPKSIPAESMYCASSSHRWSDIHTCSISFVKSWWKFTLCSICGTILHSS